MCHFREAPLPLRVFCRRALLLLLRKDSRMRRLVSIAAVSALGMSVLIGCSHQQPAMMAPPVSQNPGYNTSQPGMGMGNGNMAPPVAREQCAGRRGLPVAGRARQSAGADRTRDLRSGRVSDLCAERRNHRRAVRQQQPVRDEVRDARTAATTSSTRTACRPSTSRRGRDSRTPPRRARCGIPFRQNYALLRPPCTSRWLPPGPNTRTWAGIPA